LIHRPISHFDIYTVLFGAISVAAFWFAIQLCWSVVGSRGTARLGGCWLRWGYLGWGL
jgi:hypothetical protein